jgi:hypothetical protein
MESKEYKEYIAAIDNGYKGSYLGKSYKFWLNIEWKKQFKKKGVKK